MITVRFIHWGDSNHTTTGPLTTWFRSTHWAHEHEQVWIHGTRYIVVRVEHTAEDEVACFVKEIN